METVDYKLTSIEAVVIRRYLKEGLLANKKLRAVINEDWLEKSSSEKMQIYNENKTLLGSESIMRLFLSYGVPVDQITPSKASTGLSKDKNLYKLIQQKYRPDSEEVISKK